MRGIRIPETRRARTLRTNQTSAEQKLWCALRNRNLNGFKFVRQEPIGPWFADFCCRDAKLVVEVDGATHGTETELRRDQLRTSGLQKLGYRVIRFQNIDIYEEMDGVLDTILVALEGCKAL